MSFSADFAWQRVKTLAPFPSRLEPYYRDILSQYEAAHILASTARMKGYDPTSIVESKTVFDLADRVNQMLRLDQFEGLVDRLRELLHSTSKERAALTISQEIALGKFGALERHEALSYGVRAGLAVMTDGVTVAPLEGISGVTIKQNDDNTDYVSVSYAGPMRSAGGTEAAFSLVIADVTAKKLGLSNYRARQEEIDRFAEELRIYERDVTNFQYKVTDDDIRRAISNLPVEIDGIETDPIEVVVHRNLKRVATDRLRGGALRVLNDGVIGRAHKLSKKLASLNISGWDFLAQLKGGTQQTTNETEKAGAHFEEVISGRAVLSMPRSKGGFRLRYGRSINTGLSTIGIHPAVATLLDFPVVAGTQVKVDMPGKAATIAFVDSIEGPTISTKDGRVLRVSTVSQAEEVRDAMSKIIDLGDVLITYGDFLESNKALQPSPYVSEWWAQDLGRLMAGVPGAMEALASAGVGGDRARELASSPTTAPTAAEAIAISHAIGIPLHPSHTPRFDRVGSADLVELRQSARLEGREVVIGAAVPRVRWILNTCLIEHRTEGDVAIVGGESAVILRALLRLDEPGSVVSPDAPDYIRSLSGIQLGRQSTTTIGVRVGRPEKAMVRRMKPPVHVLFPVGYGGGAMRDVFSAARAGRAEIEVINLYCNRCNQRRLTPKCEVCGEDTAPFMACPRCGATTHDTVCPNCKAKTLPYSKMDFDFKSRLEAIRAKIPHSSSKPVKGVRGLTSVSKVPEAIEKGIIRSRHNTFVYKDGTLRIDATNEPLTHFRPRDVKGDLQTLVRLGYTHDHKGVPLKSDDQVLELKPQDIIVPADISSDLVKMAQCIDDELQNLYGLEPFYNVAGPDDLLGKLVIGLAPHTSVGVAGRIVGFSATEVCLANPYWHSAKRRDCDGDGDSILMLVDALLNFSLQYVPAQIGGYMDTPLLIQPVILPAEVDEQAHNFDVAETYPLEFYEKTLTTPPAASVASLIEHIGSRLESETQFYGYGFTHPTSAITIKRSRASYSTLRTLNEKIAKQIEVASLVEAVSTRDVVESIIKTHLIRDIMGNAKKYATQAFKCKGCGLTLRRPPLSSKCPSCGGEIRGTLTRASVEKYLQIAQRLAREYDVDSYLRNRLDMLQRELDQLFQGPRKADQLELTDFLKPALIE
ncbi:MAG: DNA polymerase II large subunit [Nitrososphaerota archaeon]|jgi:DNA polymerase II large subunit|nr:DNA polymerase II large subunit [Nitrososphaerota archaeon]MDG6903801.1 DNA polymerase II large subunit [Nitrososphaerota archaeon]MDG6911565.1 DNA polymerase II large subunit [Nitrososphaerota archaeon]MDG6940470.1 DNA polymerase II large subunit [Nitrososphaerota archaeon]MDG6960780.1 DNA polymerase II large subunit [Nitrososphaerota archaeon]